MTGDNIRPFLFDPTNSLLDAFYRNPVTTLNRTKLELDLAEDGKNYDGREFPKVKGVRAALHSVAAVYPQALDQTRLIQPVDIETVHAHELIHQIFGGLAIAAALRATKAYMDAESLAKILHTYASNPGTEQLALAQYPVDIIIESQQWAEEHLPDLLPLVNAVANYTTAHEWQDTRTTAVSALTHTAKWLYHAYEAVTIPLQTDWHEVVTWTVEE